MSYLNFKIFSLKNRGKGDLSNVTASQVELISKYTESIVPGDDVSLLNNDANYISEAPDDGSQYVRKNESWDKLTTYSAVDPISTNNVAGGYPLGSDWYNTATGEKFYQKANGVWISYTATTTPPIDGGDSPVMFADYATQTFLPNAPIYYNGLLDDGVGATLTSGSNGKLYGIVGSALQPLLYGQTLLVKDEMEGDFESGTPSNRIHNGVYILTSEGSNNVIGVPDSPWVLTRVDYANEPDELFPSQVNILSGANQNRFFLQQNVIDVIGDTEIVYEINYVPPTQVVTLPVIHMDTVTTAPLPSCTYMDEFPLSGPGGVFTLTPTTSYLTATVNGPLGVINGVNVSNSFTAPNRKILVKNQADNKQNGDYEIIQNGSATQPWKLRRITTNYSSFDKNTREWKINNEACTLYGNRYYMNYYTPSISMIGTTPITFSELSAVPSLSLQDVIDVNKVADRVEFTFSPFNGSSFTGGYDYLLDFTESNQDDGIYIYGDFAQYGTGTGQDIVKINSDGTTDTSFNVGTGFNNYPYSGSGKLAQTAAGKLYVSGSFTTYNGITANRIVRLNVDGSIDTSFVTGSGFYGGLNYTNSIGLDSLERVYVAGGYHYYNGVNLPQIARLLSDGTLDTTFVTGSGFSNTTTAILVNSDDTLFVGGHFGTYKGVSSPRFVKLLPNGDIDTSFVIGAGFNNIVTNIVKTLDNKIIVTGHFTTYQGLSANRIIKLNLDGSVDTSFNVGTGFSSSDSYSLKVLLDGKLLIKNTGTYNGVTIAGMLILNTDGSIFLNAAHSYTGFTQLSDGRFIGMSNTGTTNNQLVQIVNGFPIKDQKLTFSEVTGKAEYTIDTLDGTTTYELLPKHLIETLIANSVPVVSTPSLQSVTNVGNSTTNALNVQLGDDYSIVNRANVTTASDATLSYAFIENTGKLGINSGDFEGTIQANNLTTNNVNLEFPQKPFGSYTIATTDDIGSIPVPTLQQVTYAGNTTTDVITSSLGFETLLSGSFDPMAFIGITSINNSGIITYKGVMSLQEGSLDGTGSVAYLTTTTLSQNRFLSLPNKDGILAVTNDIVPQINSNWNATSGVAQILNKPTIDSTPTNGSNNAVSSDGVFDALALKADLVAGKVPASQLPSYVDDVIEGYYSVGVFYSDAGLTTPITGEISKIYVDLLANKSYRWSGSVYIQISNAISSIDELTDVTVSSPLNGQLLQYNLTTSQWENKTITVGTGDMQTSTYDIDNDGIVDFAETVPVVVRNNSVTDILRKGTIVYLNGSTGFRPNAFKAQANAEATSSGTFGVVLEDIATNTDGTVAMLGTIHTLDTRNAATGAPYPFTNDILLDGDVLWLDPNNAGYVTKTKPQAPNHIVFIGVVARTHPSLGRIVYRITNGFELDELHNVLINPGTLANNDVLYYDSATSLWKHKQIGGGGGVPLTRQQFTYSGAQSFTLSGTPSSTYLVFVNGQELNSSQYSVTTNVLTILNTLQIVDGIPDSVNILYTETVSGVLDYYTKAQVDTLIANVTPDINTVNATKITLMYNT